MSILSRFSEPSTACLICSGRLLSADPLRPALGVELEPELGGDHHLAAERRERLAHQLLVGEGAVDFRRVEEGDAALDGRADQRDHLCLVGGRAVAEAHAHAAEPEGGDFQAAVSEFALLHVSVHSGVVPGTLAYHGRLPTRR